MKKPVIGLVPLYDDEKRSYWMLPGYMQVLEKCGAVPLMLPLTDDSEELQICLALCDGILLTGGHDVDPALYGEVPLPQCGIPCPARDRMEKKLLASALEENKPIFGMDIHRTDNPWLTRAAQSLAEAFRLAASKELDIEFTELVTGYRIRTNNAGAFVDVYLYDSLSSGAGYAVSVADNIETLLNRIRELLASCDCGNACHKCLKHYRNQYVHGLLDRFAALELLDWGVNGELADSLTVEGQKALLLPLESILRVSGCTI